MSRRRRTAYAAQMAAKRRRQRIWAIVGGVVLVILFAYEIPHTLKLLKGTKPVPAPIAAPTATPTTPTIPKLRKLGAQGADPFASGSFADADPQIGAEPAGHDPFGAPAATVSAPPPAAAQAPSVSLPSQIVIGTPGGNRHPHKGWIVILASIPTGEGRVVAVNFANKANNSVGSLSVLNSSNRRPLRGGYWVVYTGPYNTLDQVSRRADEVHAAGYRTAYIRELIVYR